MNKVLNIRIHFRPVDTTACELEYTVNAQMAHFHVKIARDGETFTTQIWFPEDERNATDIAYARFQKTNVLALRREGDTWVGHFDFVV